MHSHSLADHLRRVGAALEGRHAPLPEPHVQDYGTLQRWVDAFELTPLEVDLLLFAVLPELDERFCATFQALQPGLGFRRPSLGLAVERLRPDAHRLKLRGELARSVLFSSGLLQTPADAPFFDRALIPGPALAAGFDGSLPWQLEPGQRVDLLEDNSRDAALSMAHVESFSRLVDELARWSDLARCPTIVCDGAPRAVQRLALALGAQNTRGECDVVRVRFDSAEDLRQALLIAVARDAVLLVEVAARAQRLTLPDIIPWTRPVIISGGVDNLEPAAHIRKVSVPRPRPGDLSAVWGALLPDERADDIDANLLGNRTHLDPGSIGAVVELACESARLDARPVDNALIERSIREIAGAPASPHATTREPLADLDSMVLVDTCRAQLDAMVQHVRLRPTIDRQWQFESISRPASVVGLFHGEPGTGKTLAAEALARSLAMPLMAVDIAQVTSKYIGETEERLDEVFREAEGFRALLFLDEADAFFGARTSLRESRDRWANLQTNFLLQRLESFEGVAVLASNMRQNIDPAFTRRLNFIVHFPEPNPAHRLQLFYAHLGDEVAGRLDLDKIVKHTEMVGGEIRNITLNAMYEATGRGVALDQQILEDALRKELIKTGKRIPDILRGENR